MITAEGMWRRYNLKVHHRRAVNKWLEMKKEQIEVFYLPSYSPELNPDEYLNSDLKQNIRSGLPARSENALTKKTLFFYADLTESTRASVPLFQPPSSRLCRLISLFNHRGNNSTKLRQFIIQ